VIETTELTTTAEVDAVVSQVAEALGETKDVPLAQLRRAIGTIGRERALLLLEAARIVQAAGGMWLHGRHRPRTFGGVYFELLRRMLHGDARVFVFPRPPKAPTQTPLKWSERLPVVQELASERGVTSVIKMQLVGRPGRVSARGDCVMMQLSGTKAPQLPKGLPMPSGGAGVYTVYIAAKQWRRVADALRDPEDRLIVEGWPQPDPESRSVALFVTAETTTSLQRALRERQQSKEQAT
jgi:hypothetical protein